MLTALGRRPPRRRQGEDGFTLVELLVAMAAAIVVLFGATSVMIGTLHQTQRTFTKVDATRRARTGLANIENELHSACVSGNPPIQGVTGGVIESDANNLVFLSFFGTAANPTPVWHKLTFNSAAATLTDSSYNVSGTGPNWTQGSLISTTTVLTNVAQQTSTTPAFQYYAYQTAYTDAGGNVYWMIEDGSNVQPGTTNTTPSSPLSASAGLSAADASNVVEVVVNLLVGASSATLNNPSLHAVDDSVTDAISLRLTTPPDYVPAGTTATGYGPCQ
jgi:prepilin-type N-terminal cleavage/methylation domain-containing protein